MLDHTAYDKVKLLHELSCLLWFIEQHAKEDAQKTRDTQTLNLLNELAEDLESYIHDLYELL